jgi:transcriptional antiterminator NusG
MAEVAESTETMDVQEAAEVLGAGKADEAAPDGAVAESDDSAAGEAEGAVAESDDSAAGEAEGAVAESDASAAGEAEGAEDTPEAVDEEAEETDEEAEASDVVEALKPTSPYDLPGDWYVIHSYSGYENKVKANLETRIQSMHMEDRIFEVHIPMEDVVEFKGGKKVTVPKKVFPGYILVRMSLDDDSWYAVRNTPGVTGFVAGNAQKPTPLSRREVERFLGVQEEEEKGKPRFKPEWDVGEQVRVVTGPFADFNGTIEELNVDQQKVVVLVNIFGRDTPVELGFEDIQKN